MLPNSSSEIQEQSSSPHPPPTPPLPSENQHSIPTWGSFQGGRVVQAVPPMPYMLCYPYQGMVQPNYGMTGQPYPTFAHSLLPTYFKVGQQQPLSYFQGMMPAHNSLNAPHHNSEQKNISERESGARNEKQESKNGNFKVSKDKTSIPKIEEFSRQVRTVQRNKQERPQKEIPSVPLAKCASRRQHQDENASSKRDYKPSLFHNFQKHLVTLLKSKMRLDCNRESNRRQLKLVTDLWAYFCNTTRVTKRFLKCLLGHIERSEAHLSSKYYQDYKNILKSFDMYSEQEIINAQTLICREIARQGRRILANDEFNETRMHKKEEFKAYFEQFVEEVEVGRISKRLPKKNKQQVLKKPGLSESSSEEENEQP